MISMGMDLSGGRIKATTHNECHRQGPVQQSPKWPQIRVTQQGRSLCKSFSALTSVTLASDRVACGRLKATVRRSVNSKGPAAKL